jgi:Thiol-disulfide isomerase and thioredoxins
MNRRDFLRHGLTAAGVALAPFPLLASPSTEGEDAAAQFLANSFPDLHGEPVALSRFAGKPLVVNFWATWCAPCVKEMPDLDALSKKHPGIGFLGLAVDTQANVERFIKKVQVSYPLLVAGHSAIEKMKALGNRKGGLPYTVIFDSESRVARDILGQVDSVDLDSYLASISKA